MLHGDSLKTGTISDFSFIQESTLIIGTYARLPLVPECVQLLQNAKSKQYFWWNIHMSKFTGEPTTYLDLTVLLLCTRLYMYNVPWAGHLNFMIHTYMYTAYTVKSE